MCCSKKYRSVHGQRRTERENETSVKESIIGRVTMLYFKNVLWGLNTAKKTRNRRKNQNS